MNHFSSLNPTSYMAVVTQYASNNAYYKVNGRPFLSTFNGHNLNFGQANPNAGWKSIFKNAGLNPFFVPDFDNLPGYPSNFFSTFPDVDGAFSWEAAWPYTSASTPQVSSAVDSQMISQAHAAGKIYMMPWSPFQYKHMTSGDYWYRPGDLNFIDRLGQIMSLQPDYVELITWNDAGEGHYVGNYWNEAVATSTDIKSYADGYDHTGWLAFLPQAISALKGGVKEFGKISTTKVVGSIWYRPLLTTGTCTVAKPSGNGLARDLVNYAFVLPAGSSGWTIRVLNNGAQVGGSPFAASVGLNAKAVGGLSAGSVSVQRTAVEEITIINCTLIGEIPDAFGALKNLTMLRLRGNSLTGSLPSSLNLLHGLEFLDVTNNQLSGDFPALPNLFALNSLCIAQNCFTGPVPTVFGDPRKLIYFYAEDNLFSVLPASIGQLTNLEELYISGNAFSWELPSEIWNLANLKFLLMSGCNLFGSLAGVAALRNLKGLDVSKNQFSGEFPTREILNLENLEELHLVGNQFSGGEILDMSERNQKIKMCVDRDFQIAHVIREGFHKCLKKHGVTPYTGDISDSEGYESDSDSDSESEPESE
ncbi:hypothetical protein CcCBS67573_g10079 [Chytriomyces confervae]|uniref:Glycoside hydrolase family 71 protein n=1 Tax=Chytriomyces confervae TaxID=246404 RepID=A0A507DG31_9FUNG|nr:hypothetical protein CcCBS67573_g10079 [Chytriomyces confervae]